MGYTVTISAVCVWMYVSYIVFSGGPDTYCGGSGRATDEEEDEAVPWAGDGGRGC